MIEKDCDSVPGMATISDIFEIFIDNLLASGLGWD
jgi:hypothetical protein